MSVNDIIVDGLVNNGIEFVTTVPCKQLAGVIDKIERNNQMIHVPANKEDEGMGLCAGAYMGGKRGCIIMQNTAIGVTINTLLTLIQYYQIPLPMLISYRGDRPHALSRQDDCRYLSNRGGFLRLECPVTFGASGAPVFNEDGTGIFGVVSAKRRGLAFASPVESVVEQMLELLP